MNFEQLETLRVEPGDIVVATIDDGPLSADELYEIQAFLRAGFPDNKAIICARCFGIGKVKPDVVLIPVSRELLAEAGEWSDPLQMRLVEDEDSPTGWTLELRRPEP